jgi:predicted PurR-regulated permease PerM
VDVAAASPRRWPIRALITAAVAVYLIIRLLEAVAVREVFFLGFMGILIATILHYPVMWLSRIMPRPLAAVLTLLGVLGLLTVLGYLALPMIADQVGELIHRAPEAWHKVERWWLQTDVPSSEAIAESVKENARSSVGPLVSRALPIAASGLSIVSGMIVILVLGMFLAYSPATYARGVVRLVPKEHEAAATELLRRLGHTLQHWMAGTFVTMAAVGVLTSIGLLIVGVDEWLALGVLIFFGEFIPYIGPLLAGAPGVAVALLDSTQLALWTLGVYLVIQVIENHILTPLVMKRAVHLSPVLLILWQILFGASFGILGIIIATPLLACIKVTVDYLYVERALGKA